MQGSGGLVRSAVDFCTPCECNCFGGTQDSGFVLRNSRYLFEIRSLFLLFTSLVRSKLEYGCVVWNPGYAVHVDNLEKIQRRFLKYVSFKIDGIYPIRGIPNEYYLNRFHVNSLEGRRVYLGVLFLRKIICFEIDCPYLLASVDLHVPRLPVRNISTFYLPFPRTNVLRFSPLFRICQDFCNFQHVLDIFNCTQLDVRRAVLRSHSL